MKKPIYHDLPQLNVGSLAKVPWSFKRWEFNTTRSNSIVEENWFQLCAILWQLVEPNILNTLRSFKTCNSFWKKAQNIFANDIQCSYDLANPLASLK